VLCRDITFVPGTATMSLVGLFNVRASANWPSPAEPFYAYTLLVGGEGEGVMELAVLHAVTEQLIYRYRRWYTVPSPDYPVHFPLLLRRCIFPAPGRYLVHLRFEGEIVTQRHLDVRRA
jgi:hypothetical protein